VYSTCLFCHASLGANEVIERFPVGRRLAFDPAKGRLWVVCTKCGGWNLTPLEERWEAIEECEREFRNTRLRVSTDHIGLTRLSEGLELVRIGPALRPELALWRYGRRLIYRRWRYAATTSAIGGGMIIAGLSGPLGLGFVPLIAGGATGSLVLQGMNWWRVYRHSIHVACRVQDDSGNVVPVTEANAHRAEIQLDEGADQWCLVIPRRRIDKFNPLLRNRRLNASPEVRLTGPAAVRAAGMILPHINQWGASKSGIKTAASLLEQHDVGSLCRQVALTQSRRFATERTLKGVSAPTRLALEMAAHEETERRAMEGELAELEAAWRDAEEIAAIADNMFLPNFVTEFMRRQHEGGTVTPERTGTD